MDLITHAKNGEFRPVAPGDLIRADAGDWSITAPVDETVLESGLVVVDGTNVGCGRLVVFMENVSILRRAA